MKLWVLVDLIYEANRVRTRSGRRDTLGFGGTVRDKIGFERRGKRKLISKRKRPKRKFGDLLARGPFRSGLIRSGKVKK